MLTVGRVRLDQRSDPEARQIARSLCPLCLQPIGHCLYEVMCDCSLDGREIIHLRCPVVTRTFGELLAACVGIRFRTGAKGGF